MEEEIRKQLSSNNELLILTNKQSLELLKEQKEINNTLIKHLKEHYERLDRKTKRSGAEESNYQFLKQTLIDFWDYR